MFSKNKYLLFASTLMSSFSIFCHMNQGSENMIQPTTFILILKELSYVMWHSFFFVPKILGALFLGNKLFVLCALILFICMIVIESYVVHSFIKTKLSKIIQRMTIINIVDIIVQGLATFPLFYLVDLHNHVTNLYFKVYSLYILIIIASLILLFCRIATSYCLYAWFDKTHSKKVLKTAMIRANGLSYLFVICIFLISTLTHLNFIF